MGRDRAIRYLIHYVVEGARTWTPAQWRTRRQYQIPADGKPTPENIRKHCERLGGMTGTKIRRAWIVDQKTGATVAEYRSPDPPEYRLGYMQGRGAA